MVRVETPSLTELRQRRSMKWQSFEPDILPLPVAEMDVRLAEPITERLLDAVRRSDTGYAAESPEVAKSFAGFAARRYGWQVDPDQVKLCADVSVGMVELMRRLLAPGDPVVISPPVYPPFYLWAQEIGARVVEAPLAAGADGPVLDLDAIESAFRAGAKVYLLCTPHNPVGRVHTADELRALARLAADYEAIVLSDEIHAPLTLAGATHVPFLTVSEEAARHGFAVVSASKAWNLAGLKCAQIVTAHPDRRGLVAALPQEVAWRTGHLGALATITAYDEGEPWLDALLTMLDDRHAQLGRLLDEHLQAVGHRRPQAGYLAWLDCRALGLGDDPSGHFLTHGRVALLPGPSFGTGGAGFVRLNVATGAEILDEAVARMAQALASAPA